MNPARALADPLHNTHGVATRLCLVAAVCVLAIGVVPASTAQADPTLSQAEKQVSALNHKMELATEEYNEARDALAASKKSVAALEPRAKALRAQVSTYEGRLSTFAANAYVGGRLDVFTTMLNSGSPQAFLDQSSFLNQISAQQRSELDKLLDANKKFREAKAKVDAEYAKQAAHEKVIRDKRSAINKDLVKWQQLSAKLGGPKQVAISTYDGPATGRAAAALQYAYKQQGKWYGFGDAGPNTFDCSGLTMASWAQAGLQMPHSARGQYAMFPKVSLAELRPGDLVMYGVPTIHHVAMYVGNGKVIHAAETGTRIQIVPVARGGGKIAGAVRPS